MTENPPNNSALILFAREPVRGKVKTRLIPALGEEGAFSVYRQLLQHQKALVSGYPHAQRWLAVEGDVAHPDLQGFPGQSFAQQGEDLGQRMGHAFSRVLREAEKAILIGADIPGISSAYLDAAFAGLDGGADVVLGPALDGGYVLIGMKREQAALFSAISWGSNAVLAQTRARLKNLGLDWQELPPLQDIDDESDLDCLRELEIRDLAL